MYTRKVVGLTRGTLFSFRQEETFCKSAGVHLQIAPSVFSNHRFGITLWCLSPRGPFLLFFSLGAFFPPVASFIHEDVAPRPPPPPRWGRLHRMLRSAPHQGPSSWAWVDWGGGGGTASPPQRHTADCTKGCEDLFCVTSFYLNITSISLLSYEAVPLKIVSCLRVSFF